jgi:23S rRNA pseudouridine1911/1915/1917 synthase
MIYPDEELDDYNAIVAQEVRTLTIPDAQAGQRLDQTLAALLPEYSRSKLQLWLKQGHVLVDGQPVDSKLKVWGGEQVSISPQMDENTAAFTPESIPLDIQFEDEHLLVLHKPAGLVVHPGSGNWSGTLLNGLLAYRPEARALPRAGIVHRLDKDTSGLMVVAKTSLAQNDLIRQLQARTVKRVYWAVVHGTPRERGSISAPIGRHPRDRVKMAVINTGKEAITHFQTREQFESFALVECRLETGRTHQIRVHMAKLGHPLVGDTLYGGKMVHRVPEVSAVLTRLNRQALHAAQLSLLHPATGQPASWKIPLADDIQDVLSVLRAQALPEVDEDFDEDDQDYDDYDGEIIYVRE